EAPNGMKFYGHAVEGLPEGFKEGPFAFERNGKFYLTYPWVRKENGTECLAYAMSDKPMGPYEYKGIIMKEHENGCWTNHHSIVEYKGQWYLFYHNNAYSPWFDKNRSVCADSLFFNPDGTIQEVKPTLRGIGVTDARTMVQMDRYSSIGGGATIEYNDTTNRFLGWKTILPKDGFVTYANVQIPEGEYTVWVNKPGFWGRAEIVDIKQTSLNLKVNRQPNGLHELVLTNKGEAPVEVDWISLNPRRPLVPSSAGGIATGTYRNLFVEAGHSEAEVEAKLREVFDDVFKGKHRCYFEVGKDMAYISDIKNNDVRTEGMSYGMMIAVQFDRKDIFDRLWRWSKKYMQMQDGPMKGYFRWSCKRDGTPNANGPASDGELYYITSLIFASNRWGNSGEIDYLKEAQYILDCIQPRETEFTMYRGEDGKKLEKPIKVKRTISLIDPATGLITFVPGAAFTDPSYHIPAFYEVWARYAEDGRASYWRECARKSREYLHKSVHPMTGLNDDYNNFDGTPLHNNRLLGDCFRYDSWRVPMNIALDYSWACSDRQWQQNYGHTIQNFFFSQGIDIYLDQYNTDGTLPKQILPAGTYQPKLRHSIGLMATLAASSIMCSHPKSYDFIDRLWNAKHKPDADGYFDAYYDGLLRLFAFMHLSGHYRVIEKTPQLETYLRPATKDFTTPDSEGFVRRWMLHDPISKPNRSNTVFTDTYLNETFPQPLAYSKKDKAWNAYDSQLFNVKLYRLATCTGQQRYGVIFWATTIIECDEEIKDVRFAIGSNSASKWWLNGQEMAMLSGDRRMVRDDVVSRPVTLKKGRNIITGAVINGPGMSDFCFRIVDADKYNLRISTAFR
ncbi:MAG: glycosyl hydrolase family 8, partial [Prevotella sp.]|nr:glycosyl hydrolase family 8 [Prevotella sp.]